MLASLPGRHRGDEADIEAISVSGGKLWICGSHCRVRRNRTNVKKIDPRFRSRASRRLLGVITLTEDGGGIAAEHPERICLLHRKGKKGILILYDSPDEGRIKKSRYRANWIALSRLNGSA